MRGTEVHHRRRIVWAEIGIWGAPPSTLAVSCSRRTRLVRFTYLTAHVLRVMSTLLDYQATPFPSDALEDGVEFSNSRLLLSFLQDKDAVPTPAEPWKAGTRP